MGVMAERQRGVAAATPRWRCGDYDMSEQWRHEPRVTKEQHEPDDERDGDSYPKHNPND
jgi:hypothetical protein